MLVTSSEASHQEGLVNWFRQRYPGVLCFHIPNGEHRALSVGVRLKKLGVIAGIPDLFIPAWKLWIELKREKGGKVSPEQEKIHDYLRKVGYTVIIGYGAEDASRKILLFRENF